MSAQTHIVIIGSGSAGSEAALTIRRRDPECRITQITGSKLLFISRYELPRVFNGVSGWRELLAYPPEFYDKNRITVRRNSWVNRVDAKNKEVLLKHKEEISYDKLLVASGGGGYLPEGLREFRPLMNSFGSYEDAVKIREALPKKGHVIMLGGDMTGLDLARTLVGVGHRVTLVASEQLFWPHEVTDDQRVKFVTVLEDMGIKVELDKKVVAVKQGTKGKPARRVVFDDGGGIDGDAVMPFCGLMPSLDFMIGADVDIERGLLVNPELKTTNDSIWAVGDVCQIWSPEENNYLFYYGWHYIKEMGKIAAINMTGGKKTISTHKDDQLFINKKGEIDSPYWKHK